MSRLYLVTGMASFPGNNRIKILVDRGEKVRRSRFNFVCRYGHSCRKARKRLEYAVCEPLLCLF